MFCYLSQGVYHPFSIEKTIFYWFHTIIRVWIHYAKFGYYFSSQTIALFNSFFNAKYFILSYSKDTVSAFSFVTSVLSLIHFLFIISNVFKDGYINTQLSRLLSFSYQLSILFPNEIFEKDIFF